MRNLLSLLPVACVLFFAATEARADTCNGFTNNLVSNCSFESGGFSSWSGTSTTNLFSGVDTLAPYAGSYEAYLASNGSTATLTQNINTIAGGSYLIKFALMNDTSPSLGYTNSFALLFGGNSIFSESAVAAGPYTLYSFVAAATSASTSLSFVTRNDGGDFDLDSVSVTTVTPEPSSWMLLGTGLIGCVGAARRRVLRG